MIIKDEYMIPYYTTAKYRVGEKQIEYWERLIHIVHGRFHMMTMTNAHDLIFHGRNGKIMYQRAADRYGWNRYHTYLNEYSHYNYAIEEAISWKRESISPSYIEMVCWGGKDYYDALFGTAPVYESTLPNLKVIKPGKCPSTGNDDLVMIIKLL